MHVCVCLFGGLITREAVIISIELRCSYYELGIRKRPKIVASIRDESSIEKLVTYENARIRFLSFFFWISMRAASAFLDIYKRLYSGYLN